MTTRDLVTMLFVVVVAVAGCRTDKGPPPERENPFVILNGQLYVGAVSKDGKRFYIKPEKIWECDASNHCTLQPLSCPTCSGCDCRLPACSKWCLTPQVLETAAPVPGGDPAVQPPQPTQPPQPMQPTQPEPPAPK